MTLMVCAYRRGPAGEVIDLPGLDNDFFGVEVWRRQVWGSEPVKALGLRVVPRLDGDDIHAEGPELDLLEQELHQVIEAAPALAEQILGTARLLERRAERSKRLDALTPGLGALYRGGLKVLSALGPVREPSAAEVAGHVAEFAESLRVRARNALGAVRIAREHAGGVYIG